MDISQFSLEGRIALITGGSRGIGEATAVGFAKAGADVIVTSRNLEELDRVAGLVRHEGRKALAVATHVGRLPQIRELVEKAVDEFGRIDILVNNAGTSLAAPMIDLEEKVWDTVMNLNLKGIIFLSQAAARVMKENGGGKIINVASINGYKPTSPTVTYAVSKAAVIMATRGLALEWAQYGIRVNAIAPGPIETRLLNASWAFLSEEDKAGARKMLAEQVPLGRIGEPKEIADTMIFLASDASSYITGQTFTVDGGLLI